MARAVTLLYLLLVSVTAATAADDSRRYEENDERANLFREAAQSAWGAAEMVLGKDTVRSLAKGSAVARRQLVCAVDAGLEFVARVGRDFLEILGYKVVDFWGLLDAKTLLSSPGTLLVLVVALLLAYQLFSFLLMLACAAAVSLLGPLFVRAVRVLLLGLVAAYASVKYELEPAKAVAVTAVAVALYLYSGSPCRAGAADWAADSRLRRIDERVAKLSRRVDEIERRGSADE